MKNLFVPYELSLKAKEAGFDEETLAHYLQGKGNKGELFIADNKFMHENHTKAPLYQQLIDWFMEKGYVINILSLYRQKKFRGYSIDNVYSGCMELYQDGSFDYYEAMDKAFEKAFELIKK